MQTIDERKLTRRAADGDAEAVAQLYDAYEKRLYNYCHRISGNREDAADATQEAFCNVIQRLPGLDVETLNLGAYLFTAARNACLDLIKQTSRAQPSEEIPEDRFATVPLELDPERVVLTEEQKRLARDANARLPEKQRTVLALRELAELSYDDIATTMQMSSNAVAQLISRARLNFFKQLRSASVVLPPLDETGQRAIELAAARQDGRIADDELSWLEQHLLENESSRVNVEAMHESTKLYRAIGPIAVVAFLRNTVLAQAAEAAGPATVASGAGGAGGENAETTESDGIGSDGAGSGAGSRHGIKGRRVLTMASLIAVSAAFSLAVASSVDDGTHNSTPSVTEGAETLPVAKRKTERDKSGSREIDETIDPTVYADAGPPTAGDKKRSSTKRKRTGAKNLGGKDENADTPATPEPQPEPQPTPTAPTPEPTAPTGPTSQPPTPPRDPSCRIKPCIPRLPIP